MGTRLVAGVFVAALVVAGCGGDDSGTSESSISKKAFLVKADAICTQSNRRMEAVIGDLLSGKRIRKPSQADSEKFIEQGMIPNLNREIEELRALGAPSGEGDRVDDILTALEEGVETAEDNPQAVITSSDAVFGIASRLAGEYGLRVCGSR